MCHYKAPQKAEEHACKDIIFAMGKNVARKYCGQYHAKNHKNAREPNTSTNAQGININEGKSMPIFV